MKYKRVVSNPERVLMQNLRLDVFVQEQQVPFVLEIDARDYAATTLHLLLLNESDQAIGTGRVLWDGLGLVHIGRLAIHKDHRGHGYGKDLLLALERMAALEYSNLGKLQLVLSAQEQALGFYTGLGYSQMTQERYLDAGIWHRDMTKTMFTD